MSFLQLANWMSSEQVLLHVSRCSSDEQFASTASGVCDQGLLVSATPFADWRVSVNLHELYRQRKDVLLNPLQMFGFLLKHGAAANAESTATLPFENSFL